MSEDLNPLNAPSMGELLSTDRGPGDAPGTYMGRGKRIYAKGRSRGQIPTPPKTRYMMLKTQLDQDRTSWYAHWLDLKRNFLPYRSRWLDDGGVPNQGTKKMQQIIDNTPPLAIRTLASGLMSGITNPSRPWLRMKPDDKALYEERGVPEWCEALTLGILRMMENSNYYDTLEPEYREIGTFGTMAQGCYEIPRDTRYPELPDVNFVAYTTGEYWIGQDSRSHVDTFLREFKWTAAQIVKRFVEDPYDPGSKGWENVSPQTRALWQNRKGEQRVNLYHVIEPNRDYIPGVIGAHGMPIRSVFFEEGGAPDVLLEVSGFHEMPVHVARWDLNSDDAYGHSPAMESLPDAKSLQVQQRRLAQAIDKMVDPPLIGDANLKKTRVSMLPGDVTWLEGAAANSYGLKPLYEVKPELQGMLGDIEQIQKRIEGGCYTDVFQMLKTMGDQLKSGITATEISARQQERLLELGPLLNRLNNELYGPTVNQLLNIGFRRSKLAWQMLAAGKKLPKGVSMIFPPPPPAMRGKQLKIEYVSILAQAMRMSEINAMQQLTTYVLSMAQTHPDVLDKLDFDKGIDIIADRLSVPPEFIISTEQANKVRDIRAKQKAQQQQQEQQLQLAQVGSAAVKNLGQAPLGGTNALDQLISGVQAAPRAA